jgi:hypothetical protein
MYFMGMKNTSARMATYLMHVKNAASVAVDGRCVSAASGGRAGPSRPARGTRVKSIFKSPCMFDMGNH